MDYGKLLLSGILSGAIAHPQGHLQQAEQYGVPGEVDYRAGVERYSQPHWEMMLNKKREGDVHAAGFVGQEDLAKAVEGTELQDETRLFNALYKALYAAGVKPSGTAGDPELIAQATDNKPGLINALLAISALADYDKYKRPERTWDLSPEMIGSGYGLKFTMPF